MGTVAVPAVAGAAGTLAIGKTIAATTAHTAVVEEEGEVMVVGGELPTDLGKEEASTKAMIQPKDAKLGERAKTKVLARAWTKATKAAKVLSRATKVRSLPTQAIAALKERPAAIAVA